MIAKNDPEIREALKLCYTSTKTTAKVLFPDMFYAEFSLLHDQILDLIDSGAQKIAIAAPRGIGKTSIARTVASKGILYRDINFISYVSNSATVAELQTENIKRELLSNQIIRKLFGNIKVTDYGDAGLDDTFSKMAWVAFGNTLILPRGAGQQVRGLIWDKYRPQLIIVDDLEKKEEVMNEDNREKLKEWFFSDLMNSVNKYADDWRVIYIDTLKHEDSLLQLLLESSDWKSLVLSVCDTNYESLAPSYMSTEEIKKEVESHREKGMLDVFYMEFMNLPTSSEDAAFKQKQFKYYEETDKEFAKNKKNLENVVIVDPAKTVKLHSAESAVVGIGIDLASARLYVRDVVSRKLYPDELYDETFGMVARLNAHILAIEVTGLNEFIKQPIENEIIKRRIPIGEPIWLSARGKKEERIAHLVPYYRQGYIYHNKSCCGGLEAQLMSFPRSKYWDIMDALAYIIEVMEIGERYFRPTPIEDEDPEDEFRELKEEYEEPLTNWRYL